MGNTQHKRLGEFQMSCQDDLMCQNIDSRRSTPDNMVLTCPGAKCLDGTCSCGPGCERDSYTSMCCTRVEKDANGNSYCIEEPYKKPVEACKVPDQNIDGVVVSGKQICNLYNKYQNK